MKIVQKLRDRAGRIKPLKINDKGFVAGYNQEQADLRDMLEQAAEAIDGLTRLTTELTRRLMEKSIDDKAA